MRKASLSEQTVAHIHTLPIILPRSASVALTPTFKTSQGGTTVRFKNGLRSVLLRLPGACSGKEISARSKLFSSAISLGLLTTFVLQNWASTPTWLRTLQVVLLLSTGVTLTFEVISRLLNETSR